MTLEAGIEMVNDSSPSEDQSPPQQQEQTPPPEASEPPPPPPPPPPPEAETPPPPPPPPAPESPPAPAPEAAEPVEPPPPPPPPAPETPPPPKIEPPKPAPPKVAPKVEQKPAAPKKSSQLHQEARRPWAPCHRPMRRWSISASTVSRAAPIRVKRYRKTSKGVSATTIVIGTAGQLISKSVSSSGNPVLDRAASEALSRSAPFLHLRTLEPIPTESPAPLFIECADRPENKPNSAKRDHYE